MKNFKGKEENSNNVNWSKSGNSGVEELIFPRPVAVLKI